MAQIRIKTGDLSVSWITSERHPLDSVKAAKDLIDSIDIGSVRRDVHSKSIDFISFAYHYAKQKGHEVELFINDKSVGKDDAALELVFADFNRCYDFMDSHLDSHKSNVGDETEKCIVALEKIHNGVDELKSQDIYDLDRALFWSQIENVQNAVSELQEVLNRDSHKPSVDICSKLHLPRELSANYIEDERTKRIEFEGVIRKAFCKDMVKKLLTRYDNSEIKDWGWQSDNKSMQVFIFFKDETTIQGSGIL